MFLLLLLLATPHLTPNDQARVDAVGAFLNNVLSSELDDGHPPEYGATGRHHEVFRLTWGGCTDDRVYFEDLHGLRERMLDLRFTRFECYQPSEHRVMLRWELLP